MRSCYVDAIIGRIFSARMKVWLKSKRLRSSLCLLFRILDVMERDAQGPYQINGRQSRNSAQSQCQRY